jgi:hypothetical protein
MLDLIVQLGEAEMIVDPATGEAVILADAPDELVASVLGAIQQRIGELMEAKRYLGGVMIERFDAQALWTIHAPGVKVTSASAAEERVVWDAPLLHELLDQAVEDGLITRDAALRACSTRVEYVTHAAGLRALEKLPALAERIAKARSTEPAPSRTVRVSVSS